MIPFIAFAALDPALGFFIIFVIIGGINTEAIMAGVFDLVAILTEYGYLVYFVTIVFGNAISMGDFIALNANFPFSALFRVIAQPSTDTQVASLDL